MYASSMILIVSQTMNWNVYINNICPKRKVNHSLENSVRTELSSTAIYCAGGVATKKCALEKRRRQKHAIDSIPPTEDAQRYAQEAQATVKYKHNPY
jgi:hypothetical protein